MQYRARRIGGNHQIRRALFRFFDTNEKRKERIENSSFLSFPVVI